MTNVFLTEEEREKVLKAFEKSRSSEETITNLFKVQLIDRQRRTMVLTTTSIYFYDRSCLKSVILGTDILHLTISLTGTTLAIHTSTASIKFSCFQLAKLIKNLLKIRQKERYEPTCELFLAHAPNLQQETQSFWHVIRNARQKKPQTEVLKDIINVSSRNCITQISNKLYSFNQEQKVVYLSGEIGFMFRRQDYCLINSDGSQIFIKEHLRLKRRTINKDQKLREALGKTKRTDYTQQIHFILQNGNDFQIITAEDEESKALQELLQEEEVLQQKDIRSIAHKLFCLAQENDKILYSLSPKQIFRTKEGFKVAEPFCWLQNNINLDYLSPEQLIGDAVEVNKINQWKIAILLYELAYGCLPFPLEYVAYCARHSLPLKTYFPHNRYEQMQSFLQQLIARKSNVKYHKWFIR